MTDVGVKRINNEDVFDYLIEYGFFALADGMGGHKAGEIAAKEAIAYLCNSVKEIIAQSNTQFEKDLATKIKRLFENANDWIYRLSKTNESLTGMGTTLCSILFLQNQVLYSHIGDSRIYFLRDSTLNLVTNDHSMIIPPKAKNPKARKILTQVIGSSKGINPEIGSFEYKEKDLFLICSDGLSDFVKPEYIKLILKLEISLEKKAAILIETAKRQGSTDNITVILVQI